MIPNQHCNELPGRCQVAACLGVADAKAASRHRSRDPWLGEGAPGSQLPLGKGQAAYEGLGSEKVEIKRQQWHERGQARFKIVQIREACFRDNSS